MMRAMGWARNSETGSVSKRMRQVLAAEADGTLIGAAVFVGEDAGFGLEAGRSAIFGERAVVAVGLARRNRQHHGEGVADGGKLSATGRASGRASLSGMLKGRPSGRMPRACTRETVPL